MEFIFLKGRLIFDYEFWDLVKKIIFKVDISYYLEELFIFIFYEIPKEAFKYLPIYFYIKYILKK